MRYALLGLIVACSDPQRPPAAAPAIVLEAHLPSGHRIDSITSVVDGTLVRTRRFVLEEASPAESLFDGPLSDGDHEIQVRVVVHVACGLGAEPHATIVLRSERAFSGSGSVVLDVFARDAIAQQLRANWKGRNIVWRDHGRYRWHEQCFDLAPRERSICRARADVAEAKVERDIVRLSCAAEKLRALEALQNPSEAESLALGAEADACIGFDGRLETTWTDLTQNCPEMP